MEEETFLIQQRLNDGSWYQVSEWCFILTAQEQRDKCVKAHPDRLYRIAQRQVIITALDI